MVKRAAPDAGMGSTLPMLIALFGLSLGSTAFAQEKVDEEAAEAAVEEAVEEAEEKEVLWEDEPYVIKDGAVDFGTYNGYRRYHAHCHTCHGPDGLGSSYAPGLVESIQDIGYEGFIEAVVYGIENVGGGQQSVMPSFAEDANVTDNIDDIWAYLKGRADDVVPRGRPQRIEPEEDPVWQERRG